jgi:hypothetical protein
VALYNLRSSHRSSVQDIVIVSDVGNIPALRCALRPGSRESNFVYCKVKA